MNHNYAAIMAGGVGSRFWPFSRDNRPKQFLDILGTGQSLIQMTYARFLKLMPANHIYILTNAQYRDLVAEQLPDLPKENILCEPSRNNTAPCIAWMSFKLHALDPQANFIVAPSDHVILKEDAFVEVARKALEFTAWENALVTLGIKPTRPDTGYGYIEFEKPVGPEIYKVSRFTEKPDLPTAQAFVDAGKHLWNAGIFVWRASSVIDAFRQHEVSLFELFEPNKHKLNSPEETAFIEAHYPNTPNVSIDYAIMEKAENVFTIPADIGWSDLGTWGSLFVEAPKSEHNNVVHATDSLLYDTSGCLIQMPKNKLVVVKDLKDYIIVDDGNVLLITPINKEQEIKTITGDVKSKFGPGYV